VDTGKKPDLLARTIIRFVDEEATCDAERPPFLCLAGHSDTAGRGTRKDFTHGEVPEDMLLHPEATRIVLRHQLRFHDLKAIAFSSYRVDEGTINQVNLVSGKMNGQDVGRTLFTTYPYPVAFRFGGGGPPLDGIYSGDLKGRGVGSLLVGEDSRISGARNLLEEALATGNADLRFERIRSALKELTR
jgi:hypothetical protein